MEEAREFAPIKRETTEPEIPSLQHELNEMHDRLAHALEGLHKKLDSVLSPERPEIEERKAMASLVRSEPTSTHGRWIEERIGHVRAMTDQVDAIADRLQL